MEETTGPPASAAPAPYLREAVVIVAFTLSAAAALLLFELLLGR